MKKIITYSLILIMMNAAMCYGKEFRKVGTSAAQFLKIGVGARAVSLAGAFGAVANDASTIYWNPAGMVTLNSVSWTGSHANWFADISHQYSGLVLPFGNSSALGLSAIFTSMGEEEITTEENPTGTGYYWDASDIAVGISYARWMTDRFALGVTMKYITQKIWNESASTFAVDVGTYLTTGYKGIVIGMCFSNFGGSLTLQGRDLLREYDPNPANTLNANVDTRLHTEPWPLPVNFRVGIAIDMMGQGDRIISSEDSRMTLAIDGTHPNDDSEKLNLGLEYAWRELLFGRIGYGAGYDLVQVTYGLGVQFKFQQGMFSFDYATASYGELDYVNYLSIGFKF